MPTRGTTSMLMLSFSYTYFNPRAHEGHDGFLGGMGIWVVFQSTCPRGARRAAVSVASRQSEFQSTCPRGARRASRRAVPAAGNFNPRAHEGHDGHISCVGTAKQFQSTCPRGARLDKYGVILNLSDFNPRAHEGHDPGNLCKNHIYIFQSTCPRGARHTPLPPLATPVISIHVPTRGTTGLRNDACSNTPISIHVPTRGTTITM